MRVLIAAGYVRSDVWRREAWVGVIARTLARMGVEVTVAAEGVADPRDFAPASVVVRTPRATRTRQHMLKLRAWVRELSRDHDAVISTTPSCDGDILIDLCGSFRDGVATIFDRPDPFRIAAQTISHPFLPETAVAELAALGTRRVRSLWFGDSVLPIVSAIEHDHGSAADGRTDYRSMLGIPACARIALMSSVHVSGAGADECLAALARSQAARDAWLVLVGPGGHACEHAIERAGLGERSRILGPTRSMPALLRQADFGLSAHLAKGSSSARFVADCLRIGLPVLADARASGGELVREVLGEPCVARAGWESALDQLLSDRALESARAAAAEASHRFCVSRLGDALIQQIESVVESSRKRI